MAKLFNGIMRAVSTLLGLLMVCMGTIWILQGLDIAFLDSFMAGGSPVDVLGHPPGDAGRGTDGLEQYPAALSGGAVRLATGLSPKSLSTIS